MKKKKVVSYQNERASPPWVQTAIVYLLLDKWHAPQWLWGAFGLLFLALWISQIIDMMHQIELPVLFDQDGTPVSGKQESQ